MAEAFTDFNPSRHVIDSDIMRLDPIAGFLVEAQRHEGWPVSPERIAAGRQLAVTGLTFLLDGYTPTPVPARHRDLSVEGGGLVYNSSAGTGYVWFRGRFKLGQEASVDEPIGIEDIDQTHALFDVMVSSKGLYAPGEDGRIFRASQRGLIDRHSGSGSQADLNFVRGLLRKAEVLYRPAKTPPQK